MRRPKSTGKPSSKKSEGPKKRRLGLSRLRLVEMAPRELADAEIAKDFEDSKLFPDDKE